MPESIGSFINDSDSRKSGADASAESIGGNAGRINEPEIINGFEAESPTTERIAGSEPRRTKSGRVDGRTLRGKRGTPENPKESVRLESLKISDLLYSIHLMGAEICRVPEMELDKEEATKLADAIADVSKYYITSFDPKKVAWVHLAVIAGGVYGTRIFAYRNRIGAQKSLGPQAVKPSPKSTPVNPSVPQAQKVNGVAREDGKIEIDPVSVWGMSTGEL
jgi:hypothetical protein